jgi:hypothetical protein
MKYFLQLLSIWGIGFVTASIGATINSTNGKFWFLILAGYFWASFPQLLFNFLIGRLWKFFYLLPLLLVFISFCASLDKYILVFLPYGLVNAAFIFFEKNEKEHTK